MSPPIPARPEDAPGHYGAGYGEQVPEDAPPRPAPATDSEADEASSDGAIGGPGDGSARDAPAGAASGAPGDDGTRVDFTAADVSARPPAQTPTEHAPDAEKAGLLFERS